MSDIEDGLFNNSDDDNDSDAESVAESEVDFTNDKQPAVKTAPKLNIGKTIANVGLDEDDDEVYGDGDSDGEGVIGDGDGDGDDDDDDVAAGDDSDDENVRAAPVPKAASNTQILGTDNVSDDDDGDEDDEEDEDYLQKFDTDIKKNYIVDYHPECMIHNYEEISALTKVIRDKDNVIVDPLHRTIPYLTKYERARVLGQRAKQINLGARPFVKVPENIIDGNLVAEMELAQKRIPFILRRPLPGNSGSEYWNLKDLEIITF
jgi:DNA-directed RNA polymerase I, II, and III subunit RPABC2